MATFNKFQDFVEQLGKGVHQLHAGGHVLKVYASNELPLAADTMKTDIAEITPENGYPSGGTDIQNDYTESSGTGTLTGVDVEWTASGGSFGPLQYIILYNDDATSPADALVAWWDYGSSITVNTGEKFTVDFGTSILTIA